MGETEAVLSQQRRISPVWIVPVVAMLLGLWLVVDAYRRQGPVVEISFATAEGVEEDNTPVKFRNVEVGVVTDISLHEDLSRVVVRAELSADARKLLREDTRFWVVRPRISRGGISGLGTIVSGAYIEVAPGEGSPAQEFTFEGLEQAPPTPAGTPGLRINLVSESSGSLGVGDPVLYRGYTVGRVEDAALNTDSREVRYAVFIESPYDSLVTTSTRFWNASGISATLSAEGASLSLGSLETLVSGGVAFDQPRTALPGESVAAEETFQLYPDAASIDENPHRFHQDYVVAFSQSVRGLSAEAPVTFRGIRIGSVQRIMVREGTAGALNDGADRPIPVLIRIQPGRFEMSDSRAGVVRLRDSLEKAVANGLRGTLESGNLLTGSLYVNFDFFDRSGPARIEEFEGYPEIPTVSRGLDRLQQQVGQVLTKLNDLPMEETLQSADTTMTELADTTQALRELLDDQALQRLPRNLERSLNQLDRTLAAYSGDSGLPDQLAHTIGELNRTLERVQSLADTLERDPNALIFPRQPHRDPQPRAGTP